MSDANVKHGQGVTPVTDEKFQAEVLDSPNPVIVDFWAPWCGPCRMLAPIMEELAGDYAGKVSVRKLNVDENQGTAMRYGVQSIPTVILFQGGEVVDAFIGVQPKAAYRKALDSKLG